MPKFLRHTSHKYSKLGLRRKKKQVWRRPTGRDNKMREQRKGKPAIVAIGYSTNKKEKGKINNKTPVVVNNVRQLENIQKNQIVVLGRIGKKNKIEIAEKANELKIEIYKFNPQKYLKMNKKKDKKIEKKEKENKK
ncbi:MAG: 50S ribosomal protein L32e [Candidatus Diapherotrites archaeon ADurb.Bin253]|jgi:ribosomal protein L32E|nr:MAG: 50S ribosomal protein L32e [Candidatus Diapherotrites archaeon ADurb.Bin253]HNZ52268.1 eL32 family ribosomal protein [Candidatus Pacearchaeota archaeon]HOC96816.1 eL32 family ribosomal protein [Candidatus Pacearchaeota archaeon]HOF44197.1 eL32 family ribosomal protein [Candidatus Pacearchaeota archaeon]HOH04328.1 eL32 family ribosomal protein [Candidatus Pacearchaeota archaeon]